ncbi:MAG: sulfotransferase, partial [Gammaproteobacteria bacterium]
ERADDDFTRTKLAFALGKVLDDAGEYARAFDFYAAGNRLKFAESRLDFDRYFAHIDDVPKIFTARPRMLSDAAASPAPIFIIGMPRSGTTLVEQILSRHPDVSGCGELPCIEKAIARMEKRAEPMRVYPRDFLEIGADALAAETRHYLSWVARLHELQTKFFTDKMPFNFVHVWLIKALFPAAAIVHCHRHPLDVILSNYFQLYASDISFVYDLQVLARYYVRYYRLMRHWRKVFGDEIYKVQYETLVGDKEEETRKLIAAARLPWDASCLDMKKSGAAVRTASIWQVRQGIYTTSRERWRNYERQLAPAVAILRDEGVLDAELGEIA